MLLFYQGKFIEEYSKKELIEMVKELFQRWDNLMQKHQPDMVAKGEFITKEGGK